MDCGWISWCALKPEAQAAWIQAVGSIAAIAVPISLYLSDRASRRATEKRNKATFLFLLRPVLRRFEAKMRTFILQNGPFEEGEVLDVGNLDGDYAKEIPALMDLLQRAPSLPGLDDKLTLLAHRIEDLQAYIDAVNDMMGGGLHSAWINNVNDILDHASVVEGLANDILTAITPKRRNEI